MSVLPGAERVPSPKVDSNSPRAPFVPDWKPAAGGTVAQEEVMEPSTEVMEPSTPPTPDWKPTVEDGLAPTDLASNCPMGDYFDDGDGEGVAASVAGADNCAPLVGGDDFGARASEQGGRENGTGGAGDMSNNRARGYASVSTILGNNAHVDANDGGRMHTLAGRVENGKSTAGTLNSNMINNMDAHAGNQRVCGNTRKK
jgi:hypothetical protein